MLVVGTHLDLIETKFRVERIATLRAYVLALCRSPSGSRATGFPDITFKHLQWVSPSLLLTPTSHMAWLPVPHFFIFLGTPGTCPRRAPEPGAGLLLGPFQG